jgi:O-glycosyl hydrolase
MAEQTPVAMAAVPSADITITVDPGRRFQTIDGFGASITESSAEVLFRLTAENRDAAMRDLFDPTNGKWAQLAAPADRGLRLRRRLGVHLRRSRRR